MTINKETAIIQCALKYLYLKFGLTFKEVDGRLKSLNVHDSIKSAAGLLSLCLSMASLVTEDARNVLEIGTGLGERTLILSGLFPKAQIFTVDLPMEDPEFCTTAWRGLPKKISGLERFHKNIDYENITYINSNSFFLPSLGLPKKFELILVDGSHVYPAVAWDIMFSYSRLRKGGFMFIHDYSTESKTLKVKEAVDYVAKRIPEKVLYFPGSVKVSELKKNLIPCIRKGGNE